MSRPRPPTMQDVARLAGVSTMTVSRALRSGGSASEETRRRILEAADQLGYVPDSLAAGLSSRRTGFVACTIPSINNSNFADTVRGLVEGLKPAGLQVLLGYTNYDMAEEEALIEGLLRRRPEAIVVTGGAHTARCRRYLGSSGVPVVETWDLPRDPIGHVVGFSNAEAGRMMARYLYDRGYRRIGFIGGDTDRDTRGLDRRRGFELALRELGLDTGRLWASGPPPITMREGALAMERLLEALPDTEAVMCVSDLSAFGAMSACLRRGLRVPQDVAVAGFGAYDLSANCTPEITTIDVDPYAIGARAAAIIRETLERRDAAPLAETPRVRVEMPLALLERASTRRG